MAMRFLAFFVILSLPFTLMAGNQAAEDHMQNLGNEVIQILNDEDLGKSQVQSRFEKLLDDNFALESMGKFVLGRYWRNANAEEKAEYQKLFRKSILKTYSNRFETGTKAKLEVTGSRTESDGGVVVTSQLNREEGKPIRLDWKLYAEGNGWRVYDVLLEGISMSITQRSEYAAVIQREGGKVKGLNKALQSKTSSTII